MRTMRILVGSVAGLVFAAGAPLSGGAPAAHAALSPVQAQAIIDLLISFNVPDDMLGGLRRALGVSSNVPKGESRSCEVYTHEDGGGRTRTDAVQRSGQGRCVDFCAVAVSSRAGAPLAECVFKGQRVRTFGGSRSPDLAMIGNIDTINYWNTARSFFRYINVITANYGGDAAANERFTGTFSVIAPNGEVVFADTFLNKVPVPTRRAHNTISVPSGRLSSVTYTLKVVVDSDNFFDELNEANNVATSSFTVVNEKES